MAKVTGIGLVSGIDLYTTDTIPTHQIGQLVWDGNAGKAFRYALIGGTALVMGNLLQEAAQDTQFENMAVGTAGVAGDSYIQVTNGTTTIVPALFKGGSVLTYTAGTVAVGDEYTVNDITGTLTSGGALQVYIDRPLSAAYTTSAKVVLKRSPWGGVIQMPQTTQTGMPVGLAVVANAATSGTTYQYGWVQTHGPAAALSDNSTYAVGSQLSPSLAVAGAVGVNVAGTTHGIIGWAREAAASAHAISIFLQID